MTTYVWVQRPLRQERWHDAFIVTFLAKSYWRWARKVAAAFGVGAGAP